MLPSEHSILPRIVDRLPPRVLASPFRLFFGGSFDPPHIGHARLPSGVLADVGGPDAWLVYVPAARSPHKETSPAPDHHRLAMLRIALRGLGRCVIWDTELRRAEEQPGKPSYWAQTWETVRTVCGEGTSRFLIGADQARSMHRWHRYESFWRDALVMLRGGHDEPGALLEALEQTGAWSAEALSHWRDAVVSVPLVDASSTHIRAQLSEPGARKNPIAGLDDRVHDYILEHGLYAP